MKKLLLIILLFAACRKAETAPAAICKTCTRNVTEKTYTGYGCSGGYTIRKYVEFQNEYCGADLDGIKPNYVHTCYNHIETIKLTTCQ